MKLACLYDTADRVGPPTRGRLTRRDVVAVRGTPAALGAQLWPRAESLGAADRPVIVLGDGAPWIWHLAAELFPRRVEILDWYHADDHISAVARVLYGDGTDKAAAWRTTQLDRSASACAGARRVPTPCWPCAPSTAAPARGTSSGPVTGWHERMSAAPRPMRSIATADELR